MEKENNKKEKKQQDVTSVKKRRFFEGEVVSDKMQKTVVVKIVRRFRHSFVGKIIQRSKKYKVHDEKNLASIGDLVEIYEGRPLSKTKHMVLNRIINKAC